MDYLNELLELEEIELIDEINFDDAGYNVRERPNHMTLWNDQEFFNRFRLSKDTVVMLSELIQEQLQHPTERNHAVSPLCQLLIALRFYASGSLYVTMGDFGGIHKTTAGKIIKNVSAAIVQHRYTYLRLPTDDEMNNVQQQFYEIARFPRVIGAVDCTHIRIQYPENFRNRKGFFSLNVQAVCNANYEITDIVARWPGASHDSNIFDNSRLRMRFEADEMGRYLLLGDGGYPVRFYLITPLNNPGNAAEHLFNRSQICTRTVIERTFGIWKRRFPILSVGIRCRLPLSRYNCCYCNSPYLSNKK